MYEELHMFIGKQQDITVPYARKCA